MERDFSVIPISGSLSQPCEVHPKFQNEIPEIVCFIRSLNRSFRNLWSNGKRPQTSKISVPDLNLADRARVLKTHGINVV